MGQPLENKSALRSLGANRRRFLDVGRSLASALQGNGGLNGVSEDATSDKHSVLKEPPPPQLSTRAIEPQGEPPPEDSEWSFNLKSLEAPLTLPPVPAGWLIFEALPSEEARPTTLEAMLCGMERCVNLHRPDVVG